MVDLHRQLLAIADEMGGPLLALDTSGAAASVCRVGWRRGEVDEEYLTASVQQTEAIGKALADAAAATRLRMSELRAIVVGIGPGSFTGLRVGLAMAKGVAYAAHVPLYGVSSLAMLAASQASGDERIALSLEARRGEIFAAVYDVRSPTSDVRGPTSDIRHPTSDVRRPTSDVRRPTSDVRRPTSDVRSSAILPSAESVMEDALTTPAAFAEVLRSLGSSRLIGDVPVGDYPLTQHQPLRAAHGIIIAAPRLRARVADDLTTLVPSYLKVSEAERKTP